MFKYLTTGHSRNDWEQCNWEHRLFETLDNVLDYVNRLPDKLAVNIYKINEFGGTDYLYGSDEKQTNSDFVEWVKAGRSIHEQFAKRQSYLNGME